MSNRIRFYENFEDDDDFLSAASQYSNKGFDDETHPWEKDYEYPTEEEEEEEEELYNVEDEEDFDYIISYVEEILKSQGLVSTVKSVGDDLEILVLLQKDMEFSKLYDVVETLKNISYMEEFDDFITNISIWKSKSGQPLIVFDLIYKPYKTKYVYKKK